ncbi:alpha/beta hydrolase [Aquimarina sp. 2201CG1-2-11]|uniref:alpha/beta fold hydrolase n=1 Tax=Aquimarina discodermiae TaxID=3231043 RepID=UPI00346200D9
MKTLQLSFISFLLTCSLWAQKTTHHNSFDVTVEGKGETLFLLPGLSCSANVWKETINKFKDTYEIHTFTLAGYGGVPPVTEDNILATIKKDLIKYITKHRSKNSILMGHSIGGFMSLLLAIDNETIVSKIIVVDALPFLAGLNNPSITEETVKSSYTSMKDSYLNMNDEALKQNLQNVLTRMIRDTTKIDDVLKDAIKSDRRTLGITAFEMMSNDIRIAIAAIKIPTLVMTNWNKIHPQFPNFTKDTKLSLYKQQYKNCSSCTVEMIEKAEHFIMLDNPETFYTSATNFISK